MGGRFLASFLVCALSGTALADELESVSVDMLTNPVFKPNPPGCEGARFTFGFTLFDTSGEEIGRADFCVLRYRDVASDGRLQRFADVRYTAYLEDGSLTAEMLNHEIFDLGSRNDFTQVVEGRITGGTGIYTGAWGTLHGDGFGIDAFTPVAHGEFHYTFSFHAD